MKTLSQDSRCPVRYSNPELPEHKSTHGMTHMQIYFRETIPCSPASLSIWTEADAGKEASYDLPRTSCFRRLEVPVTSFLLGE
jgi:hypothetical protein